MVTLLCYYRGTNRPCLHATLSSGKPKSRFPVSSHEWGFRTSIMHGSEAFQYTRLVRVTSPFNVPCSSFTQRPMKEIFRLGLISLGLRGEQGMNGGARSPSFYLQNFIPFVPSLCSSRHALMLLRGSESGLCSCPTSVLLHQNRSTWVYAGLTT